MDCADVLGERIEPLLSMIQRRQQHLNSTSTPSSTPWTNITYTPGPRAP
ncbi:MAG TPA: hypothetical protein VGX25_04930 [Actinophytocola sp.]|nr:hypothetical protein [Actinophytocola sp.]